MTDTTRAALAQALEALRRIDTADGNREFLSGSETRVLAAAITAAEAALAEPQGEPLMPLTLEDISKVLENAGFNPDEFTDTHHEIEVIKPNGSAWVVVLTQVAPAPVAQPLTDLAAIDLIPTTIPAQYEGDLLWYCRAVERAHKIGGAA
jgi:hypothetical protein